MEGYNNIKGILLGEDNLIRILKRKYNKKILRIETVRGEYKVSFDPSEEINAIILGEDDLARVLERVHNRKITDITPIEREEYLIRF